MAATNIRQFRAGIKRFRKMAEQRRKDRVKAVALRVFSGAVQGTRVDTGRLKGNWQIGEGRPPEGELDRQDPTGRATLAEGQRKIMAVSGDDIIWLHNGLPYAVVWEREDKMLATNIEAVRTWLEST